MKRKLGYVGLGMMGGGMASHLVASGYDVAVHDLRDEAVQVLQEKGATGVNTPRAVAEQSEVVISSLPTPQAVEQVALGPDGIVSGLSEGQVYIDMSSIDPDTTRRVGRVIAEKGGYMLDVPVGKGPADAARGGLTLMIGGDADVVASVQDVLDTLGDEQFYCGELGMGVTTKLVNNLVSCSVATLLGEAFAMGAAAGLDVGVLWNVMSNTAANSSHLQGSFKRRALVRNFEPYFKLRLSHKDLGLAAQMAASLGATNLMGAAAYQIQTIAMGMGLGDEDQTASIKVAEKTAGTEVNHPRLKPVGLSLPHDSPGG
ncbi:MAG: NAD(P)-dependent oxidoreductase [Gemmatimonadetes bacterium]|nr:NAD(P)-dependent oxidoreductase [Gemmatimonadota bacterium]